MNASVNTPSTRHAVVTALILLCVPVGVFGLSAYGALVAGFEQLNWAFLAIVYIVGVLPGLVLGIRYLSSTTARAAFAASYGLVCLGVFVAVSLAIGCILTDVCL